MIDRNSEEFEKLIEIPLSQVFSVKGALGTYKGVASDVGSSIASPVGAGVMVGAAAAIYAGYKIYKNYISKAGVACKNNPNRRRCELEYQIKGKKAQSKAILNGHHKCKTRECYQTLDVKERQVRRDIDNLKRKLSKVIKKGSIERKEDEIFKGKSQTSK